MTRLDALPVEVLKLIYESISEWKDRQELSRANRVLWGQAKRTLRSKTMIPLQKKDCCALYFRCITNLKVDNDFIDFTLLNNIITVARNLKTISFGTHHDNLSVKLISDFCVAASKGMVKVIVPVSSKGVWQKAIESKRYQKSSGGDLDIEYVAEQPVKNNSTQESIEKGIEEEQNKRVGSEAKITEEVVEEETVRSLEKKIDELHRRKRILQRRTKLPTQIYILKDEKKLFIETLENIEEIDYTMREKYVYKNQDELKNTIHKFGAKYLESCVIVGDSWFFITSLEVYYHGHTGFDTCALDLPTPYQPSPLIVQLTKSNFGHPYSMLSIWLGHFEFLMTGGFRGTMDNNELIIPVLGPTLKPFPSFSTYNIYVSSSPIPFLPSNRLLRDFMKPHSLENYALHSQRFSDMNFIPSNPLAFPMTNESFIFNIFASFIIRTYATNTLVYTDYIALLKHAKNNSLLKKLCPSKNKNNKKYYASLLQYLPSDEEKYRYYCMKYMATIEQQLSGKKNITLSTPSNDLKTIKSDLTTNIMNIGFYSALVRLNIDKIESMNEKLRKGEALL